MPGVKTITNILVKCSCGTDLSEHATVEYSPTGQATIIVPVKCTKCSSKIFNEGCKVGYDKGYFDGVASTL